MVHCYAKADDIEGAFDWIARLQEAHPEPALVSPFEDLWIFNYALGNSGEEVDKVYYMVRS